MAASGVPKFAKGGQGESPLKGVPPGLQTPPGDCRVEVSNGSIWASTEQRKRRPCPRENVQRFQVNFSLFQETAPDFLKLLVSPYHSIRFSLDFFFFVISRYF